MTRLRRSLHFVPGGSDRMLDKALGTNADTLILDLEDAVTPDRKDEVRGVVAAWLAEAEFGAKEKTVRMNRWTRPGASPISRPPWRRRRTPTWCRNRTPWKGSTPSIGSCRGWNGSTAIRTGASA